MVHGIQGLAGPFAPDGNAVSALLKCMLMEVRICGCQELAVSAIGQSEAGCVEFAAWRDWDLNMQATSNGFAQFVGGRLSAKGVATQGV